jgi:SAM-dependent methyltransferase
MLLHNILKLSEDENIFLTEEGYSSLNELNQTLGFMQQIIESGGVDSEIRVLKTYDDKIVCLAIFNPGTEEYPAFWAIFTNQVARNAILSPAAEHFSRMAHEIIEHTDSLKSIKTTSEELDMALREYFSINLVNRQLCEGCVKGPETYEMVFFENRVQRLVELFQKLGNKFDTSGQVLEICCGNGMATMSLEKLGIFPLTTDNDRCEICQGLEHEVLKPERSIVMDATRLTHFFDENSFDSVIGFMLGTIYVFNKDIWITIMRESLKVVKPGGQLLFTVNRREEMDILKEVLDSLGAVGELIDNTDDNGIYDQWVYLGQKS